MIPQMSVRELAEAVKRGEKIWLLDVRQPWEHELARLADHALLPLQELPNRLDEVTPPEGALVVCYCHHGVRSVSAAAILQNAGFARVASLTGGIDAWSTLIDAQVARY